MSGGVNIANQATTLAAQKEYAGLDIYYNENRPNSNITTVRSCEEKTVPELQKLVNFVKTEDKKDKIITPVEPQSCDVKCKTNKFLYIFIIILSVLFLGISGFALYLYLKKSSAKPVSNTANILNTTP